MSDNKATVQAESDERAAPVNFDVRLDNAQSIVRRNVKWAAGASIVPFPLVDFLSITAVQVKMLRELSAEYDIPFMEHKVKNILASLLTSVGSRKLGTFAFLSISKLIPVLGPTLAYAANPVATAALTHATGQVFIQHFESGGNLLDFDAAAAREHFKREYSSAETNLKKKA